MDLKGSKTLQNLLATFAGESQARLKYSFFANVARREGYEQIGGIFDETSDNEKEHAKSAFRFAGLEGTTVENLLTAIEGEHEEHSVLYAEFGRIAREEGFEEIAVFFQEVSEVEEAHEKRFKALRERVVAGTVFVREEEDTLWHCRNCGYVHEGPEAPDSCPCCHHPKKFFEILATNY